MSDSKTAMNRKCNMIELNDSNQVKEGIRYYLFVIFCILIAIVLIVSYIAGLLPIKKGELADTDCYIHLIRATDLYDTGDWYHPLPIKSNTPYGEVSHWTRPFDVLLLLGAVPGLLFVDFETALFWWGVAISPVFLIFTLIALNWATKPLLSRDGTFLVVLLFLSQIVTMGAFIPARPDHHSLMVLFFVVSIGLTLRLILRPFKWSLCYLAGGAGALSMWCLIESIVPVCITISVLALLWIMEENDFLKKGLHYSMAVFIFCCISLFVENPLSRLFDAEYDRLSVVYLSVFCFAALFWIVVSIINRSQKYLKLRFNRLKYSIIGVVVGIVVILCLFPKLLKGPLADIDPEVISWWFNSIGEMQSLLSESVSLRTSVQALGTFFVCMPFLIYMLFRGTKLSSRNGWIYIMLSSIFFLVLSLFRVRWAMYAQTLFSIIMAELLCRVLKRIKNEERVVWRSIMNIASTLIFSFGFLWMGIAAEKVLKGNNSTGHNKAISLVEMCRYLRGFQHKDQPDLHILTNLDYAGEILYRTPHEVVGSNYHRNAEGIIDSYNIMTAVRDEKALEIIIERQINIILICPKQPELFDNAKQSVESTFYQRLRQGTIPTWLTKVQLPKELSENFILFKSDFKNLKYEKKM